MENHLNETPDSPDKNSSLTPHELVMRHIENADEPVTDNDIANANLSDDVPEGKVPTSAVSPEASENRAEADELADEINKDNTGMSYKADL